MSDHSQTNTAANAGTLVGNERVAVSRHGVEFITTTQTIANLRTIFATQQRLTGAGNFTVPDNVHVIDIVMSGAGGGGGGSSSGSCASGMPGVVVRARQIVSPGDVIAYSVGAKGAGGAAAGNNVGITGSDTTFGTLTAKGGLGGTGSAGAQASAKTDANLSALINGSQLTPSTTLFIMSLVFMLNTGGASSTVGGDGRGVLGVGGTGGNSADGNNATGFGAGGGGAAGSHRGGDGGDGTIIISY